MTYTLTAGLGQKTRMEATDLFNTLSWEKENVRSSNGLHRRLPRYVSAGSTCVTVYFTYNNTPPKVKSHRGPGGGGVKSHSGGRG